jgi:hypothetical protein
MRLRSSVTRATGNTRHYVGAFVDDNPVPVAKFPVPNWVEVSAEDGGFMLCYLDAQDACMTDTWHLTLEDACTQANFEFGIAAADWTELEP